MIQVLHGSAETTHAIRTAIQRSTSPLKEIAAQYGLNQKAVAKWRERAYVDDAATGPKVVRSMVLTAEEEMAVDAFRCHTPLPLLTVNCRLRLVLRERKDNSRSPGFGQSGISSSFMRSSRLGDAVPRGMRDIADFLRTIHSARRSRPMRWMRPLIEWCARMHPKDMRRYSSRLSTFH
jgi:hypothetical protein